MSIESIFKMGMKRDIPWPIPDWEPKDVTVLNLGCGNSRIDGAINLDYPDWDADRYDLPFDNNSIAQIHAYHFLEHLQDPVRILLECQRVLIVGGHMNIVVPYYTSQMMAHDLDHKHAFCEETWRVLFNNPYYNKNKIEWKFKVHTNIIIGVVERNLCLMTQLIKKE